MKAKFVFTYPGSGRPTGRVCHNDHTLYTKDPLLGAECNDGVHYIGPDGYVSEESEDTIYSDFLLGEHYHLGHREYDDECPACHKYREEEGYCERERAAPTQP